ncbi:phytoene desaturase family protein [Bacillus pumilus]|nr:phytoene desaturase family protein [Bacillus pumilus]OLP63687.1 zeta-carotene-forming phytoene desaturase [Bacillus pumilus]
MKKHIVIAGGGIGGMISALYLKKAGHDVTLVEKKERLGGRLAFVREKGYKIDEGPTIVLLPDMLKGIVQEVGIDDTSLDLLQLDPLYTIQYQDGTSYTKYYDLERQLEEIRRVFPKEDESFLAFMEEMTERFQKGQQAFLEKSFHEKRTFFTKDNMKILMKLKAYRTVQSALKKYFSDERLRDAYALQTLYVGGNPYEASAIYSLVSYSEHAHGIYYLKGGYASLVDILEKQLMAVGVNVKRNETVEQFEFEGKRAVRANIGGQSVEADAFVINGDYPAALKQLGLQEQDRRKYIPSSGCVMVYLGLNRVYQDAPVHQFFMGKQFDQHMKEVFQSKTVPQDPSFYTFNPSIIDPSLAPKGSSVLYMLIPVPSGQHINWAEETDFVEEMIDRLEKRGFPQLRESIVWKKVRTPNDSMRDGLFEGGSFGLAPNLFQSGVFRPQVKVPETENLYAVGASVHPGGGVPIVMQSAKLMASVLLKDLNERKEVKRSG